MPPIQVCLTPVLLPAYDLSEMNVVVADVMRATTCICIAIARGAASVTAVAEVEECRAYQKLGYICAAERDGAKVDGFEIGNSPYSYMDIDLEGRKIAVTTTNGTRAIKAVENAYQVVIASFANLTSVADWLIAENRPSLILCSGWKLRVNIEDTVFAGALVKKLLNHFVPDDSALLSLALYDHTNQNKSFYFKNSPHVKRVQNLNIQRDVKYCLKQDTYPVIPIYRNGEIVRLEN